MGNYDSYASLSGSLSLQVNGSGEHVDYDQLDNLPIINGVVIKGNLTSKDLGIERGYDATVDPSDDEHIILSN